MSGQTTRRGARTVNQSVGRQIPYTGQSRLHQIAVLGHKTIESAQSAPIVCDATTQSQAFPGLDAKKTMLTKIEGGDKGAIGEF